MKSNGVELFSGESRKTKERRLQAMFQMVLSSLTNLSEIPDEQLDALLKASAHLIVVYQVDFDGFVSNLKKYEGIIREAVAKAESEGGTHQGEPNA